MSDNITQAASEICGARALVLVDQVGQGAFKRTFHVRCADGSNRALKLYLRDADERTEREVQAMARCRHASIVTFEHIGTWRNGSGEYVFSLEEFLAGGTLTARIAARPYDRAGLQQLGAQLIDAVAHIQSNAFVHRDIKPDNIMFRSVDGEPVIVDFGLVRDLAQTSLTNTWLAQGPGTPLFSSPEQLNNQKALIDWRADQFALGVVLTMCTAQPHPYREAGTDLRQAVQRVASRQGPAQGFVAWAAANGLSVLTRMVQPWAVNRYRTPSDLSAAWQAGGLK